MRPRHLLSSLALLLVPALFAAAPRPLQLEDFAALRTVGDPQLSPDGAVVAYTVKTIDLAADKSPVNLWLAHWDGSENRALTFGKESQSHPCWSPDGRWLAFLSARTDDHDSGQLWVLPRAGGEAEKLTDAKGGVDDFAWAPDSQHLVLVVRDPDPLAPDPKDKDNDKDKKTAPPIVIDRYQFKEDKEGYLVDRYSHLALFDLAGRQLTPLTSGRHNDLDPAWSPDGREIVFVSKRGADPDRTDNTDLYVVAAQAGAAERQLTTAPESDGHPAWSPDGQWIAYLHGGDPKLIEYATNTLAIIPAAGGTPRILTPALDRNLEAPRWSADSRAILALVEDDGAQTLQRFPLDGAAPEPVATGRRAIKSFDRSDRGDRIVVLTSTPDRPAEVFAVEGPAALRAITHQNDAFLATVRLATVDETKFSSADGTEIHGFLVHPVALPATAVAAPGQPPPAVLFPHGGPQSQYAAEFNFTAQLFAARGYTVIQPNPRGSTGRGTRFSAAIFAAWGSVDVQDDLAAVDDAVARGLADPDRLVVGGWSYGGMSTNYLIASTGRFKAAVSGASISNVLAGYGTDEYIRDYENELGSPWQNPDAWLRISYPFYHADRIKTPTLFLCGDADYNVPLLNSEQMYQALRTLKVPTQLVIYPGQYHGLTTPSYLLDRYHRWLAWYARWLGPAEPAKS